MSEPDLETRRRRITWRASHRGTKELDWMIGRFCAATVDGLGESELVEIERFLAAQDPDLDAWLMGRQSAPETFVELVYRIRQFHGLEGVASR